MKIKRCHKTRVRIMMALKFTKDGVDALSNHCFQLMLVSHSGRSVSFDCSKKKKKVEWYNQLNRLEIAND
jgi:hypothetical protein